MGESTELDGLIEPEHVVPTHLNTPDRVGPLTVRQLNMLLGPALFGSPAGWALGHQVGAGIGVGSELGVVVAALPLVGGALLALPLDQPIEHGLRKLLEHRFRPKSIGTAQMPAYTRIKEAGSDGMLRMTWKQECRAIWRLPTTNLRLAHTLQKQTAVLRWGRFLDGLTCPVQIVVRATPVDLGQVVGQIANRKTPQADALAAFLRAHAVGTGLVQRERHLVVAGDEEDQLADRVRSIEDSLNRAGLPPVRVQDDPHHQHVLHDLLQACWSSRRASATTIGPNVLRIEPQFVNADGQNCRSVVLSAWPRAVHTDWLAPLLDGPLPIDVAIHVEPQDTERMCSRLDTKLRQYHSSHHQPRATPPSKTRAIETRARAPSRARLLGGRVFPGSRRHN